MVYSNFILANSHSYSFLLKSTFFVLRPWKAATYEGVIQIGSSSRPEPVIEMYKAPLSHSTKR